MRHSLLADVPDAQCGSLIPNSMRGDIGVAKNRVEEDARLIANTEPE